ncbi:MAG: right-handed parallel beta-helix repeat-containing protein [Solirubrobacteraceae bacterium]
MRPINLLRVLAAVIISLLLPAAAFAHAPAKSSSKSVHHRHHRVHRTRRAGTTRRHRGRHVQIRRPGQTNAPGATTVQAPTHITVPAPTGQTYYVSPTGSDSNSGTSPANAWRTVEQADRANLKPGDAILFQGGASFGDDALMPGWGVSASGTSTAPITFGSYGQGQATITQGVWFKSDNNLVFQNLALGGGSGDSGNGFQGDGNGITLLNMTIEHADLGVNAEGDNWTIADSTIAYTGDSGMLLGYSAGAPGDPAGGNDYLVTGNTISSTGLNPAYDYGTHGIYVKVTDATITDNTISHFNNDGVSVRYSDNTISGNRISDGGIGLAWFQYDASAGTSKWTDNSISNMTAAGIFVAGTREGSRQALESFQISGNVIGSDGGTGMNLQPTTGTYSVNQNSTPASSVNEFPQASTRRGA